MPLPKKHICGCHRTPMSQLCSTYRCAVFGDLTLEVDGDKICAHRLVLSNISPVFEAMFRHSFKESISGNVDMSGSFSSIKRLHEFISFIYGEPLDLNSDNVMELLDASKKYFIQNLTKLCYRYLFKHLRPSNCLEIWFTASLYSLRELEIVCRYLFSAVFSFVKIQKSVVIDLPSWFIVEVLGKKSLPETHPNLFSTLLIVWLLGNIDQRKSVVSDIVASLSIPKHRILTTIKMLRLNQADKVLVMSLFCYGFALADGGENKPTILSFKSNKESGHKNTFSKRVSCQKYVSQHLSIMLLYKNNMVAFYCIEHKEWRTRYLPTYNGIVLGIISGNILVRVVPKGSSANLLNLQTGKSTQSRCVLSTLAECNMEIAFLPVQSNFFLAVGCLHVALIVRKFRSFELVVFRYEPRTNRWCFRMSFPLFHYLKQAVIRVCSTLRGLAYMIVTEQNCDAHGSPTSTELSYVFSVDLLCRKVVGSSCGFFGDGVMKNDCFILKNKLHFVNNIHAFPFDKDKSKMVLSINSGSKHFNNSRNKLPHLFYPFCDSQLEQRTLMSTTRENYAGPGTFRAFKNNIMCLFFYIEPYLSTMFLFDVERCKWTRTPSLPPIFQEGPSKLIMIYTSEPVSTLLLESDPDVICQDLDLFRGWALR